jgi:hypothetical protein
MSNYGKGKFPISMRNEKRERSIVSRTHHEGGGDREIHTETEDARVPSDSLLAVPGDEIDEHIGGLLGLREEENFRFDRSNDVEQILDGIAGAPGIGRGFLERWGSTLPAHGHEGGPIVTLREAQKVHATEVLRRVDVWLEGKDEESVTFIFILTICALSHSVVGCSSPDVSSFLCATFRDPGSTQGCLAICQIS